MRRTAELAAFVGMDPQDLRRLPAETVAEWQAFYDAREELIASLNETK